MSVKRIAKGNGVVRKALAGNLKKIRRPIEQSRQEMENHLVFSLDPNSGETIIRIVDSTGKFISTVPLTFLRGLHRPFPGH
jgi:uncharacterized FlaG/YvyC family protein